MDAVRAQGHNANSTSPNQYGASANSDGSITITKNGVATWRLIYNAGQQIVGCQGDLNADSVTFLSPDGATAVGSASNFLATLT